jgi:uncharacterized protein (DUF362 family)
VALGRRDFLKRSAAGAALLTAGAGVFKNSAFAMNPVIFQEKSDVSFVGSSEEGTRRQMIVDVLEPWRETVAAGIQGKTVLLKVNLVYWMSMLDDPALPLTHVDAVRGCLDFLKSINPDIPVVIGDCSATPTRMGDVATMFKGAGYNELLEEYSNIALNDLSTWPAVEKPFWTPELTNNATWAVPVICSYTDPSFYVISLCRPKTHNNMVITGVNKNILMGAPLNSGTVDGTDVIPKQFMHGAQGYANGKNPDEIKILSYNLFQMANIIYTEGTPALSVLDAWEGMEGDGPVSGTSIMQYCAVASIDPLAVDRIAAKLMGFSDEPTEPMNKATPSYTDMRYLLWIANAGFGNYDLSRINFILGSLEQVETYVKTYELSPNYTGDPSYETEWTGGAPAIVLDKIVANKSRSLDPKPYLIPQLQKRNSSGIVSINFSLPVAFSIKMSIYNLQGAEIRKLGKDYLSPGRYSITWDGCDSRGSHVPSGKYLIKFNYGSGELVDNVFMVK